MKEPIYAFDKNDYLVEIDKEVDKMGKPLKDKQISLGLYLDSVVNPLKQNVYVEKDIKSAIEWLKHIISVNLEGSKCEPITDKLCDWVDQAFPDLQKVTKGGR